MNNTDEISCFVCTTPFQIITAINLTRQRKMAADLYVVPQFSGAVDLSESIARMEIFRHVIYVDTEQIEKYKRSKNKMVLHLGIAWNYLKISSVVSGFLLEDELYSKIYISSKANIGRLVTLYYIKKGIQFEIIYFDDGESSYDNEIITTPSNADFYLRRVLFGRKAIKPVSKFLLYSPVMFKELNPGSTVNIEQLPAIQQDYETRKIYNDIFNVQFDDLIAERVVILDIIKSENLISSEDELWNQYKCIADFFGQENTIIKKHPRDKSRVVDFFNYYRKNGIPFEIILLNQDLTDKVLVTVSSTAITVPKLLFNVEPIVIYLGNMIKTKQGKSGKVLEYYRACKKLYKNPDRFIIPESVDDLKDSLLKIKEKLK